MNTVNIAKPIPLSHTWFHCNKYACFAVKVDPKDAFQTQISIYLDLYPQTGVIGAPLEGLLLIFVYLHRNTKKIVWATLLPGVSSVL